MNALVQEYYNERKRVSDMHMGLVLTFQKVIWLLLKCMCSLALNKLCAIEIATEIETTTARACAKMRANRAESSSNTACHHLPLILYLIQKFFFRMLYSHSLVWLLFFFCPLSLSSFAVVIFNFVSRGCGLAWYMGNYSLRLTIMYIH